MTSWITRSTGPTSYDQEWSGALVRTSHFHGFTGTLTNRVPYEVPYAQLTIRLPLGMEDLRDELTEELKAFAERFLAEHGLPTE